MAIFTPEEWIRLLYIFWVPATIGHLLGFVLANHDDIYLNKKIFYLGDVIGWGILAIITTVMINKNLPEYYLFLYYILHIIVISTALSDIFLQQDSFGLRPIKQFLIENLKESFLIPWIVASIFGGISVTLIGL